MEISGGEGCRKSYRNLILGCCMTGIAMFLAFLFLHHAYIRDIIYEERLNQRDGRDYPSDVSKSGRRDQTIHKITLGPGNGRM